jgi:hypothetical protein
LPRFGGAFFLLASSVGGTMRPRALAVELNCLNVGQAPAQCRQEDQNYGDHTEISGLLSSQGMLPHFSDHLEFALKLLRYKRLPTLLARTAWRLSRIDHFTSFISSITSV